MAKISQQHERRQFGRRGVVIDASRFAADCEIRHQRDNGVGVSFVTRQTALEPVQNWTVDDLAPWKGLD